MSRLTSAQVISLGDYLEPEFEPSTLTVSQLLGVLGFHNIRYPTPYTKAKLVQLFNDEIKTRASKFKKERVKKENSIASDDGIMDGVTGQPLNGKGKAPIARRSSRRLSSSFTVKTEEETSPTRPDPPKRRRSSAQPALGGASRRAAVAPAEVTLVEESEPEEEELPIKKVGRTKKTTSAGTQGRRLSNLSGEESGWDDNNIFQSGAESSSPARPSPVRPRTSRASVGPRKSRKSMSAPPQMAESSSPLRPPKVESAISPPQSPFQPRLPPFPEFKLPPPSRSRFTPVPEFVEPVKQELEDSVYVEDTIAEVTEPSSQETPAVEKNEVEEVNDELVSSLAADDDSSTLRLTPPSEVYRASVGQISARVLVWFLLMASAYATWNYKLESASIGFCDRGTNSNQALDSILSKRAAAVACNREGRPFLQLPSLHNSSPEEVEKVEEACPLPPLVPLPEPSTCTPCPDHADCTQNSVTCDTGYLLKPNILLSFIPILPSQSALTTKHAPDLSEAFFKAISVATDGLPLFGSVGLPPRCIEDPQRKRHIGNLGKAIEAKLGKERGRRVCRGDQADLATPEDSPEQAVKWGVEIGKLKEDFKQTANPSLLPVFDDMFTEAIQQLTQWGGVFVGETSDGTRYVAHKTPLMSWDCIIVVKSRDLWAAWRTTVLASILAILTALGARIRMIQRQKEGRRIAGLVQVALDTLRNQELAYYSDPVSVPEPYLSSIQLRDLVLQDEHSVNARRRLWEKVEGVVEGNANVRANLEEIEGGDETRVWRWVGSTGRTPGRKELES